MNNIKSKMEACLLAGALGDAMGFEVEFKSYSTILKTYGANGSCGFHPWAQKAVISDDTQMTLFTLEGLLQAKRKSDLPHVDEYVYASYLSWLRTQQPHSVTTAKDWNNELESVPELNNGRAAGMTCKTALASGTMGTTAWEINDSKGCGGVMRTAPLGFVNDVKFALTHGTEAGAITHGHPLGYLPAGMLSDIVCRCIYGAKAPLENIIVSALNDTCETYKGKSYLRYLENIIYKAIELSKGSKSDHAAIHEIGGGWVGEEALAIAVYCVLKYPNDIKKMVHAAINHSGDSDSTGAIAGNILGAYLGMDAVPKDWLDQMELVDLITHKADEAYAVFGA